MYQLDMAKARKILIEEEKYPAVDVDQLLHDFPPVGDPLAQAVQQWLADRQIIQVDIDGLTIHQIMENRQYHFLTAIKALNRLLDETISPEQRARLRRSLSRSVRYV